MKKASAIAISLLLTSSLLWAQSETAKPSSDTSAPAPSSSATVPDSTKVELIKSAHAVYPDAAREKQLQGQVWLKVHISETGDVEGVDVLSGDPILADAAVDAVKKWKFKPYIKDGHPVKVLYKMPMDFAFDGNVKDVQTSAPKDATSSDLNPAQTSPQALSAATTNGNPPQTSPVFSASTTKICSKQNPQPCLTPPRPTHSPEPNYSKEARDKMIAGIVVLYVVVGTDGRAHNIRVSRSLGYGLDEQAIETLKTWKFVPGTYNGTPVSEAVNIEVRFHLFPWD